MADAWLITYFQDNNIAAAYAGIRRLYQILEAYARSHPGKDLIILIALTKADSVSSKYKAFNRSKLPDYTKLIARGKEIFETIITLSHRTPYWQIGIIAVTAIGEGRANPTIENGNKTFNRPTLKMEIKKFPKPVGVEPVGPDQVLFYCVGHILKKKMQMHRRNKRKYARQIRKHTGDLARSKKTLADLEDIRDHHKAASNDGTAPDMVFRFVEKLLIFIAKIFDYPFARLGTNAHRRRHQAVAAATDTHIQTVKDLIEIGQNSIQELQIKEANCMAIIAENRKFSLELRRLSRKTVKTLKPPLIA